MILQGGYTSEQTDRDYICDNVLFLAARLAGETHLPWDPFNLELVVKAQHEPKLQHHKKV